MPFSKSHKRIFLELSPGDIMQYSTYSRVLSRLSTTTSTATGTLATSSHPARIYLKCSRTGAEIRSRVPATRTSSISSEFPFTKTMASCSRSYRMMAQHRTSEEHSCPSPLVPQSRFNAGRSEKPARRTRRILRRDEREAH